MSVLALEVGSTGVTALAVGADGSVQARGRAAVPRHETRSGWVEQAPEEIWRAVLSSVGTVLQQVDAGGLGSIGITCRPGTVLLWDRETLGSPRPAIQARDRHPADAGPGVVLAWLAEHEPHTWALVESGRYAVGTAESYLVTRMTRGTWHVTDASTASRTGLLDLRGGDWSPERCFAIGVPIDALPELVPTWGEVATTDARSFLDLALPVTGLVADRSAALAGQSCFAPGDVVVTSGSEATVLGPSGSTLIEGLLSTVAWSLPSGELTYAHEALLRGDASPLDGSHAGLGAVAGEMRDALTAWPLDVAAPLHVDSSAADESCQVLAEMTGLPVERARVAETPALGAGLLAGLGAGVWGSFDELRAVRPRGRLFEPGVPGPA